VNALSVRPATVSGLNPSENLWTILERRVEELGASDKRRTGRSDRRRWESVEMSLVNTLVDWMPNQLHEMTVNQTDHIPSEGNYPPLDTKRHEPLPVL
jgi:hypothetical protein